MSPDLTIGQPEFIAGTVLFSLGFNLVRLMMVVLIACALILITSLLWSMRKRPYHEIEPAIKPVMESLNNIAGVTTVASCQGHFHGQPPYVYFRSCEQTAASIERFLREAMTKDPPLFRTAWTIHGWFNENYELIFHLHSPEYHQRAQRSLLAIWLFGFKRKTINSDLLKLATYLQQRSKLAYFGQSEKVDINTHCQ